MTIVRIHLLVLVIILVELAALDPTAANMGIAPTVLGKTPRVVMVKALAALNYAAIRNLVANPTPP